MAKAKEAESEKLKAASKEVPQDDSPAEEVKTTADVPAEAAEQITDAEAEEALENKTEASTKSAAKAGKRSVKGVKEAEVKQAKEERKAHADELKADSEKPKVQQKPPRSKLERKGKKFREAAKFIEADKQYTLTEALELATKTNPVKFDAAVELHINLGVDPRQADQNIRSIVVLPEGTGKDVRVAVFADGDDIEKGKKAGADISAGDELLADLEKGIINFDVLVATPKVMAKLGKYARLLGPKGLMPNPKSGTVTPDVSKAVKEAKAGRVEYRVDSTGIIHIAVGKVSFGGTRLQANAQAVVSNIKAAKPASIKGTYIKTVHVATSMGPSITVEPNSL
jgi:large subunit ribosomal protein L1